MKRGLDHRPKPTGKPPKPTPPPPRNDGGYQPNKGNLNVSNPPKGGSGVPLKKSNLGLEEIVNKLEDLAYKRGYFEGMKAGSETALRILRETTMKRRKHDK